MAQGIGLKDRKGNYIEHGLVKQMNVPYEDGDGNMTTTLYTWLNSVNVYATSGTTVKKKLQHLIYDFGGFIYVSKSDLEELGGDGVRCFLTTKSLEVGKTYDSIEDMV